MHEKFTDRLTSVLSVSLAAIVVIFATYKVIRLNGMENPPANLGLNFPPPRPKVIMDPQLLADPITTQTITSAGPARQLSSPPSGPVGSYELLAVVDGVAFVEIGYSRSKMLVPATVGMVLPGGLRIDSIGQEGGRWVVEAGGLRLEEQVKPAQ